ncbi:hypothetical protein LY76DRAFT_594751 [Colletotrichum caudatum]|nr:hypothetical protein LY76DRAFT_594751 [Colletotrichum caudatum]
MRKGVNHTEQELRRPTARQGIGMAQHGTAQHSTAQHSTAQHGAELCHEPRSWALPVPASSLQTIRT